MKYLSVGPLSDTVSNIPQGGSSQPATGMAGAVVKSSLEDWKTERTNKQMM